MSRHGLRGIGQVIKANTTEKSIDDLRAEGKSRVRVVSSERVMAIIQAIVDDTIASEVGEITKRDRDRIVSDTQDRFSRVLRMQQDLEQNVDDLRGSLRAAELERERLRADKSLLETQLEAARRVDGDADTVARLSRDLARVRDAVERTPRDTGAMDEAALGRVAEKLAARDAQTARRLGTEFDDLRTRLETVTRDTLAARDAATEKVLQRVKEQQAQAEAQLSARLDREFRAVTEQLARVHAEAGRAPVTDDAVARLRNHFEALEKRVHGVERPASELADRVSKSVLDQLELRDAAAGARHGDRTALDAAHLAETLRRLEHASDEGRESIRLEIGSLRESVDDARTLALSVQAEQLRELEQRITDHASENSVSLARTVERFAERTTTIDGSLQDLRRDLLGAFQRAQTQEPKIAPELTDALGELRAASETAAARAVEAQTALAARLDGSLTERTEAIEGSLLALRRELAASSERAATVPATLTDALDELRAASATAAARAVEAQTALASRLDGSLTERTEAIEGSLLALRRELAASSERAATVPATLTDALGELRAASATAAARAVEAQTALAARLDESLAERTEAIEGSLLALRRELAASSERAATAPAAMTDALDALRSHSASAAARATEAQTEQSSRMDGSLADLRREFMALTARNIEHSERQHLALAALREHIEMNASANSDAMQQRFSGALELALDRITRAMQNATSRPIETSAEATDVLLAKIFDATDDEMSTNLGELDVEERRSTGSIAKSVGRLNEMNGRAKTPAAQTV